MTFEKDSPLLPMVIGVTGHRNLRRQDLVTLERAVDSIFAELATRYPHTPLAIMSQLAEGADRLVARVALARGIPLTALLPMPMAEYERDFETEESRREFAQLISRARKVIEPPTASMTVSERRAEVRNRQYGYAGAYLVRNSQLLIALWDGVSSGKMAGTSEVVRYRLEGVPRELAPEESHLYPREVGLAIQVQAHREGSSNEEPAAGATRRLLPPGDFMEAAIDAALDRVDEFNRDLGRWMAINPLEASPDPSRLSEGVDPIRRHFAATDHLASIYKKRRMRSLFVILALAGAAALSLHLRTAIPGQSAYFTSAYAVALIAAYATYIRAKWSRFHEKYLDYRALAEGLRVQWCWRLADLSDSAADFYLQRQKGELSWIRNAMRSWLVMDCTPSISRELDAERRLHALETVDRQWIDQQFLFFQQNAKRDGSLLRRLSALSRASLVVGIMLAAVQVLFSPASAIMHLMGAAPAAAALLHVYSRNRALAEDALRYAGMSILLSEARDSMREQLNQRNVEHCRSIVRELGREILAENGEWILLHRQRPVEMALVK